jgi:hypothetical protein
VLKVPAQIAKVETMTDGGMKVVVHTQELHPADKAVLMDLHNKIGHFLFILFSVTGIKEEDIPLETVEFEGHHKGAGRGRGQACIKMQFRNGGLRGQDHGEGWGGESIAGLAGNKAEHREL